MTRKKYEIQLYKNDEMFYRLITTFFEKRMKPIYYYIYQETSHCLSRTGDDMPVTYLTGKLLCEITEEYKNKIALEFPEAEIKERLNWAYWEEDFFKEKRRLHQIHRAF